MCGFAGFFDAEESLNEEKYLWMALARRMAQRIAHRGPDGKGAHVSAHCALAHVRLAVMDPENGAQPMTCMDGPFKVTIAYNGEIYNYQDLRAELLAAKSTTQTSFGRSFPDMATALRRAATRRLCSRAICASALRAWKS